MIASLIILCIGIYFEIGLFVFLLLALYWMYSNTSTDPKKDTLSAYSVFNKGLKKIDGTLSGEQLEAEIYKKSL